MIKKLITGILTVSFCLTLALPAFAAEELYTDMPSEKWAREAITKAHDYGLMTGMGENSFGTGRTITREEFASVLARMFGWEQEEENAFTDVSGWSLGFVNAIAKHGAVDAGGAYRPKEPVTRREMAVMLVRALGYQNLAEASEKWDMPFTDVTVDRGYISVAYDIGMTSGISATSFAPESSAKREEAAAMLVRVYERFISQIEWTHAFYAISSYNQLELAKKLDAVTLGWSRMRLKNGEVELVTTADGGNEYYIPSGYQSVIDALKANGVKLHLGIFMQESSEDLNAAFSNADNRSKAIEAIVAEVKALGLSGATIDFECLYASAREAFTLFLTELDAALERDGLTLYVAVMPATADGIYFDGYDLRAIGELADKVILMAHDYAPRTMDENLLGSTFYRNAALTPIPSVYYSLRTICGSNGVRDVSKVALNLSMTAMAWKTDADGNLISVQPVFPTTETVYSRIMGGAEKGWSDVYGNPYLNYQAESGENIFLWYEDERSVSLKTDLMRMFGISGVSVWRLGLIPDYPDNGVYFDIASILG